MTAELAWMIALAFTVTALGVAALRRWPIRIDVPNERSSHATPVPRGGGMMIVIAVIGLAPFVPRDPQWPAGLPWCAAGGALVVAALSLVDDLRGLSRRLRIAGHLAAAIAVVVAANPSGAVHVPGIGIIDVGRSAIPLGVLWIVGFTNVFNFMDGIDGIAALQALVAGLSWMVGGALSGQEPAVAIGAIIAASSLGFLIHNWSPARIFLGDVGSAFLGFVLAALVVVILRADPVLSGAGVLCVWPFVFDGVFTFIRRLCRGERVFDAHRSHLYQRLVASGLSQRSVASIYALLAVACAAAGWFDIDGNERVAVTAVVATVTGSSVLLWSLTVFRERARSRMRSRTPRVLPMNSDERCIDRTGAG